MIINPQIDLRLDVGQRFRVVSWYPKAEGHVAGLVLNRAREAVAHLPFPCCCAGGEPCDGCPAGAAHRFAAAPMRHRRGAIIKVLFGRRFAQRKDVKESPSRRPAR